MIIIQHYPDQKISGWSQVWQDSEEDQIEEYMVDFMLYPERYMTPSACYDFGKYFILRDTDRDCVIVTDSIELYGGFRVAVKNGLIKPTQIEFHCVRGRDNNYEDVSIPNIDSDGRFDYRPEGFFDVYSLSLREVM